MAIIYNVTTQVDKGIAEAWLQWMQSEHIPEILASGCFTGYRMVRLLEVDEAEGPTYAVQYEALSKAAYNLYIEKYAPALRQKGTDRWGDRFIAFRTLMQVVHEQKIQ